VHGAAMPRDQRDGVRKGADRWAWAHSAGWLHRLTGGPERIVLGGAVQTGIEIEIRIQTLQTNFQTISNFDRLEEYFSRLRKIEIKYIFEDLREVNNFLDSNFSRFGMICELKFREASVSWKQGIFD
jgi:hypothetical protein